MIEIYKGTKIFILCPAKAATGGPEAIHQLAYNLRKELNLDARIFYYPPNVPDPVHEAYKMYDIPFVNSIEDGQDHLLIVPEVYEGLLNFTRYNEGRKIIWWLSVDNFYETRHNHYLNLFKVFNVISLSFEKTILKDPFVRQASYHLVQSFYAKKELSGEGLPEERMAVVSDYLNDFFLNQRIDDGEKENIVAYNPRKGHEFTQKIIDTARDVRFVPLIDMTRDEVIGTLKKAMVYIDFGNFPGKDRIPREAAMLGCCVITGKRGAAAYHEDFPIPDEYKFEDKIENIPIITGKIKECFALFKEKNGDFDGFREIIKKDKSKFVEDLKSIFIKK
ncbi:MAG: hypothetical protein M0Z61_02680 [Nitrospiraceae bacterium]|nr:hypothetical protein [Nitrospiraceae bacterium]